MSKPSSTATSSSDEISITVTCVDTQRTDTFMVSPSQTTLSDFCYLSMAVLTSSAENQDKEEEYCLIQHIPIGGSHNKSVIYSSSKNSSASSYSSTSTLQEAGIVDGDWILLQSRKSLNMESLDSSTKRQKAVPTTDFPLSNTATVSNPSSSRSSMIGGLDFSALLNNNNNNNRNISSSTTTAVANKDGLMDLTALLNDSNNKSSSSNNTNKNHNSSKLIFHLPTQSSTSSNQHNTNYIHWEGMTLDQALQYNTNPESFIRVLFHNMDPTSTTLTNATNAYEETTLFREFHHYHPTIAKKIKELIIINNNNSSNSSQAAWKEASQLWLQHFQKLSMMQGLQQSLQYKTHQEMIQRLHVNPMDEQANEYFGKEIHKQTIQHQYEQMMNEYPESLIPVVMLYIHVVVDGRHSIQALVDSGAQMTIMSKACAERCNLLHLVDTRFAGIAVGVGQGTILGRIHIVPLKIGQTFFPCSITVMDGDSGGGGGGGESHPSGFGDKNVDLLFGLDMLKRHRCKIDLERHCLLFTLENGMKTMSTPFLQERELEVRRGGTKDLDVTKMNAEMDKEE